MWLARIARCAVLAFGVSACSHLQQSSPEFPMDSEIACAAKGRGPRVPKSVADIWDFSSLQPLQNLVNQFNRGEIGAKAKNLKLRGLRADAIHALLMNDGFRHRRVALVVGAGEGNLYWRKSGEKQVGVPTEDTMLPMDIYDAPDGSVIRIKAWGIPDPTGKTPRTFPHISKSVVFDRNESCVLFVFDCHINTTWENEAFKVSDTGAAIPKSPNIKDGMKVPPNLSNEAKNRWIDNVMTEAHIDLPVQYSDCR